MGDPKILRKKFESPTHPWQKSRIEEERELVREYGLKNKSEAWKMRSKAKNFADQAKRLTAQETAQSKKEEGQLLKKLYRFGLLPQGGTVDDILEITTKDLLERRLQTIVFKKGLARSAKQARQFITHRHILVGGKVVTSPAYIVPVAEEGAVSFRQKSALLDPEHPERAVEEKPKPAPKKPAKKPGKEDKEKKKGKPAKKEESQKAGQNPAEKAEGKKEEAKEEKPAEKEKEGPNETEKAGENKE